MNDALLAEVQAAATEAEAALGQDATLAGVSIVCILNTQALSETVQLGGRLIELSATAVATKNQTAFSTVTPAVGQLVVAAGVKYKVVTKGEDEINYTLGLESVNQ